MLALQWTANASVVFTHLVHGRLGLIDRSLDAALLSGKIRVSSFGAAECSWRPFCACSLGTLPVLKVAEQMPEHAKFERACRLKTLLRQASSSLAPSGAVAQGNKEMQENLP